MWINNTTRSLCFSFVMLTFLFVPLTVPSSPNDFSITPIAGSPTQLSASWSIPMPRNGIIAGYSVYCNTSDNQTYPEQVIGPNAPTIRSVVNGTTLATTLTGLYPFTQYSCYVTPNTSVGEGSLSNIFTALTTESGKCTSQNEVTLIMHGYQYMWINTTLCLGFDFLMLTFLFVPLTVPSLPQNFSITPVAGSPTQLSASWSIPIPRNGIITSYSVYCNISANQSFPEHVIGQNVPSIRSVVNGTTLATTLTGLNPYLQYSCYVTANTSVGEGAPSFLFTTSTAHSGEIFYYHYHVRHRVYGLA